MADANLTTRRALLKAAPALALVGAGTAEAAQAVDTVAVPKSLLDEMLGLAIPHSSGAGREWEVVPKDATDRLRELTGAVI